MNPEQENAIAAWQEQARREGWKHPKVLVCALEKDPSLMQHIGYCRKCRKAMADLVMVIGNYDDNDPQLEGARDGEIHSDYPGALCFECDDEGLHESVQDHILK